MGIAIKEIDPKHNFAAKLKQPSILPKVISYVAWQRERRRRAKDAEVLNMPKLWGPVSINLDLTTACDFDCDHCVDYDRLNTGEKLDEEELLSSLNEMQARGLKSVILIGGGEPTLYPSFSKMVRYMKKLGLQVAIVSNGNHNNKIIEIADCLDEHDWVRLSLDSGTNDTFLRMHKPRKQTSLESICEWVPKIKEVNPRFKFGFSFVIVWEGAERQSDKGPVKIAENIQEIVAATELARASGFDYISLKPFLTRSVTGAETMDLKGARVGLENMTSRTILSWIREEIDRARTYQTPNFKVIESTNLRVLLDGSWREFVNQPKTCHMKAFRQVLTPDGLVSCPAYRGDNRAIITGGGAYRNNDAADATNRAVASKLDQFNACVNCAEIACLYSQVNWWLEQVIGGELGMPLEAGPEQSDYYL